MDKFEKQVKANFPGIEIILRQKELRIRAKQDDIETIKMIIPEQIKQFRSSLPLTEASKNFKIIQAVFPQIIELYLKQHNVQIIELDQPDIKIPEEGKEEGKDELEGLNIPMSVYLQGTHQGIFEVEAAARQIKKDKVSKRVIEGCKIEYDELLKLINEVD